MGGGVQVVEGDGCVQDEGSMAMYKDGILVEVRERDRQRGGRSGPGSRESIALRLQVGHPIGPRGVVLGRCEALLQVRGARGPREGGRRARMVSCRHEDRGRGPAWGGGWTRLSRSGMWPQGRCGRECTAGLARRPP